MSKIDSLTRSVVGRTVDGSDALSARPLAVPLTTRTRRIVPFGSSLEEPGSVLRLKRGAQLVGEEGVRCQARIVADQLLCHGPSRLEQLSIPGEARQAQVTAPLLAAAKDGPLPPQGEIDLSQDEAVGGRLDRLESGVTIR